MNEILLLLPLQDFSNASDRMYPCELYFLDVGVELFVKFFRVYDQVGRWNSIVQTSFQPLFAYMLVFQVFVV